MNKTICFLIILLIMLGCNTPPSTFDFNISGTIIGQESGQLYFTASNRVGDETLITIKDHTFEYKGKSSNIYSSIILLDINGEKGVLPFVIEPGEIVLELDFDSLMQKSKILSGPYNVEYQIAHNEFMDRFSTADYESKETKNEIITWFKNNNENFRTITLLSSWESYSDFLPLEELGEIINGVKDKKLKKSREYIKLKSIWHSKKDSTNYSGSKAYNFELPNINNDICSFNSIAKDKLTYIERSGSWCGNSTRKSRGLKPLYKKYKSSGFEIITIVPELKLNRWKKWINQEDFPWPNLVELDDEVAKRGISYSDMLFKDMRNPNYLVDETGVVIATSLSIDELKEILLKKFEISKNVP